MVKSISISHNTFLLSLTFLSLILFISSVYAIEDDDVVDISKLPNKLAEALNAPLFAGQILASTIVFSLVCFPVFLITKEEKAHISAILLTLAFTIAIGWFPIWLFLILCMLIALMFAGGMRRLITGGR